MATVRLQSRIQWLEVEQSESEPKAVTEAPTFDFGTGRAPGDLEIIMMPEERRDALRRAIRSGQRDAIESEYALARRAFGDQGEWGDIIDRRIVHRKLSVVGLGAPDIAEAKTSATFSFSRSGEGGLKVTIGVLTGGATVTYKIEQELELECQSGQAKLASLHVPLEKVTQQFKPAGASEWFERVRYLPVVRPNTVLGASADTTTVQELLERTHGDPTPIGGGTAPVKANVGAELSVSFEVELGLKFADEFLSISASAKVEGSVSTDVSYELPANAKCNVHWLSPLAGACAVKA